MIFTCGASCKSRLHRGKLGGGHFIRFSLALAVNHGFHRREVGGEQSQNRPISLSLRKNFQNF